MKLIYACYGGTHSSPVAAAIHLGWLPPDKPPTPSELMALPRFDRVGKEERGRPELMGRDEYGHDVFVLGRGPEAEAMERAVKCGFALGGGDADDLLIVSTLKCVNLPMRVGGFTSRALGWTRLGRPIVLWGTCRAFPDIVAIVRKTKQLLQDRRALQRT